MEKHLDRGDGVQQAQLDDADRRSAEISRRWINRALWTLEEAEPGELNDAATEVIDQTALVLELLDRVHAEVRYLRESVEA